MQDRADKRTDDGGAGVKMLDENVGLAPRHYVTHHAGLASAMNAIMHLRCIEIIKRPIKGGVKGEIMIVHDLFGKGEVGKRALPLHQNRASADKIAIDQMSCKPLSAQMNVPLAVGTDGGRNEVSVPINDVGVGVDECWA